MVFSHKPNYSLNTLEFWNGNIPWASPKDMKTTEIYATEDYITEEGLQNCSTKIVPINSILIVVRSGILKHTFPVAISKVSLAFNQDMKALIPKRVIDANHLQMLLIGFSKVILSECSKSGATVDSIEVELLKHVYLPIPPMDEQIDIVKHITTEIRVIDELIRDMQNQINKLNEYRQSLIMEVVTGKIDVREYTEVRV